MRLFHRLFPEQRVPQYSRSKSVFDTIQCYDCGRTARIEIYLDGYILPEGWVMAWRGLKPLYNCPNCGAKRRETILRMLRK